MNCSKMLDYCSLRAAHQNAHFIKLDVCAFVYLACDFKVQQSKQKLYFHNVRLVLLWIIHPCMLFQIQKIVIDLFIHVIHQFNPLNFQPLPSNHLPDRDTVYNPINNLDKKVPTNNFL